jgi:bifunctional DNA-binding transcriptional regulator/antitoxin component of YhaV-PrlF toxin-antitoxin module
MEPKKRWLGPPTSYDVEVQIISGGRVTIPQKVITALGLEKGHTVLLHVTTTRVHGRRAVQIGIEPGDKHD